MTNAIIVLGRGINDDGVLPPDPLSRVRKAVELYNAGHAPYIVMSGAWTYHFDLNPRIPESTAMKQYAISLGVPEEAIIEESQSMDTIGNVYLTKRNISQPRNWRKLTIIASDEHMPRVKYLFGKIYGPSYCLNFVISERVIDDESYAKELKHEESSMKVTLQWLDSLESGDDKAVWDLILERHPAYAIVDESRRAVSEPVGDDLYPDFP